MRKTAAEIFAFNVKPFLEILKVDDNINGGGTAVDIVIVDTSHKFPQKYFAEKNHSIII